MSPVRWHSAHHWWFRMLDFGKAMNELTKSFVGIVLLAIDLPGLLHDLVCLLPRLHDQFWTKKNLRKSRKFWNFDTDPDPTFHSEADPDPISYLSDATLRPMVHRPSTSPFWASTAPQFWLRCGSGSSFPLWCRSESGFPKWWGSESALLLGSGNTVILTGSWEGSEMRILSGRDTGKLPQKNVIGVISSRVGTSRYTSLPNSPCP